MTRRITKEKVNTSLPDMNSYSLKQSKVRNPIYNEFSLMILFTTIGASFLISSSDLVSIYLSIELQSFAVYVLATLYRNSESSTAAGLKYFLLGGLSSALILLGTGIIYSFIGITQIESIYNIIASSIYISYDHGSLSSIHFAFENSSILFGMILITIGFLFKVAAAPFHSWAPDVYNGVPTVIRSWITTMPKISIFILLLELHSGMESIPSFINDFYSIQDRIRVADISTMDTTRSQMNDIEVKSDSINRFDRSTEIISSYISRAGEHNIPSNRHSVFKNLLLISSLFSLLIGTIVGLSQYRIKRLLAFSTISHVGFILLALAIYTEESIDSFLFYIIQYSITNVNVFLILLAFGYLLKNKDNQTQLNNRTRGVRPKARSNQLYDIEFIDELKGQYYSNPLLSIRFALSLFSMAGIPPLIGFFAKQMVLYSSIHNGYYFISIVAILVSVISASYYLKIIQTMYFDKAAFGPRQNSSDHNNNPVVNHGISKESDNSSIGNNSIEYSISNIHRTIISIITIVITMFIIHPSVITNFCQLLRLSIFTHL